MLDARLSLAASMYPQCEIAADIGTDHGMLPCHLLQQGRCQRMILADVSPDALSHAAALVQKLGLDQRAKLICANGLACITEPVQCISITGMGGKLVSSILLNHQDRLHNAVLVLSAHTDLPTVRRTLQQLSYHIARQEVCIAAGRYYVVWRAEPGIGSMTEDELELGTELLTASDPDALLGFRHRKIEVLESKLAGLRAAAVPDQQAIERCIHLIDTLKARCTH